MRRTQKQKRIEAKRPKRKYYIDYSYAGGTTRIEVSKEAKEQWAAYCKELDKGLPTKLDYEYFEKKLK